MTEIGFTFTGSSNDLEAKQKRVARGADEIEKEYREVAKAGEAADKSTSRYVNRLQNINSAPLEKVKRDTAAINKAVEQGNLTRAQADQLISRNTARIEKQNKTIKEQPRLLDRIKGQFSAMVTPISAVTAGIGLAVAAMAQLRQEQSAAIATLKEQESGDRRLIQVAESGEDLDRLQARSDDIAQKHGIDRKLSRELVFSGRSEDFEDSISTIARARNAVSIRSGIEAASFSKKFGDLDVEQALSTTLAAAASSKLDFETVIAQASKAAESAPAINATGTETLALSSVLASTFESSTGDRLKAFNSALQTKGGGQFGGGGTLAGFEALRDADEETRKKFLGESAELNDVFSAISKQYDTIVAREKELQAVRTAAPGATLLEKKIAIGDADTETKARETLAKVEVAKEIASENKLAVEAAEIEAGRIRGQTTAINQGQSAFMRSINSSAANAAQFVGADADTVEALAVGAVDLRGGDNSAVQAGVFDRLEKTVDLLFRASSDLSGVAKKTASRSNRQRQELEAAK